MLHQERNFRTRRLFLLDRSRRFGQMCHLRSSPITRSMSTYSTLCKSNSMQGNNIDKVRHIALSPFQRTILLDTDTYCLHPFPEIFDLLDHFQIAAPMDNGRFSERWDPSAKTHVFIHPDGVPECFPEFNTGVIGFCREPCRCSIVGSNPVLTLARDQSSTGRTSRLSARSSTIRTYVLLLCHQSTAFDFMPPTIREMPSRFCTDAGLTATLDRRLRHSSLN